jgi:MEMO1 family protein
MIVFAAIMPHPPESIPGTGNSEKMDVIRKTLDAFEQLRIGLEQADPETIVIISPHAYSEPYFFVINSESVITGNFSKFGLDETYTYKNDIEIADNLDFFCTMNDLPAHLHANFLDYGTLIPLYHLTKNIKPRVVQLSLSLMDYESHYKYGETLQKVINDSGKRVAIIASGDLSHKLTPDAPAGFSPNAKRFDADVLHYLGSNDTVSLMNMDKQAIAESAECGIRPIVILLGALHGKNYAFKLLSYEYPSGIGYMTARLL